MDQDFLNLLPEELKNIASNLSEVILKRAMLRFYQSLSEEDKQKMTQIFNSNNEEEKINFLKNYSKDWQAILLEETKQTLQEIKEEPLHQ